MMRLAIYRYDPDKDERPYMRTTTCSSSTPTHAVDALVR